MMYVALPIWALAPTGLPVWRPVGHAGRGTLGHEGQLTLRRHPGAYTRALSGST